MLTKPIQTISNPCHKCKQETILSIGSFISDESFPMCEKCYKKYITIPFEEMVSEIESRL